MDLATLIASIVAAVGSVLAVIVAIIIANSQTRISLLGTRIQVLDDMDRFVNEVLPNWEWSGSLAPINRYSEKQIEVLFDSEMSSLFARILSDAEKCNMLRGDKTHAVRRGECHGKDASEIEQERINLENELKKAVKEQKNRAYAKWIRI